MNIALASPLPPTLVGNILRSLKTGNVQELETALDRAQRAVAPAHGGPTDLEERLELIGAIASEMSTTIRRTKGSMPAEGIDAFLPLLRNLVAGGGALS